MPTPKTKLPSVMVVVATRRFVPVAFVKVRFPMVEEGARSSEDEARPPERTLNTGLVAPATLKRAFASVVEVPIDSEPDEFTRNVVALFS